MLISLIAAVAKNRVIGEKGKLPWNLPSDLKKFRELTIHKPVIMGRKTWESIGRPLPHRDNIVVTKKTDIKVDGIIICPSPDKALYEAKLRAAHRNSNEIMIIGGGHIYKEYMDKADKIYITEVDLEPIGDAFFPSIDFNLYKEISREPKAKNEGDSAYHSLVIYEKNR